MRSRDVRPLLGLAALVFVTGVVALDAAPVPNAGLPRTIAVDLGRGVKLEMVLIPAGKFIMGSPYNEDERSDDEEPHEVLISQPFYLGKYEVTQEQYEAVMGKNPSQFSAGGKDSRQLPVERISWDDAVEFCRILNKQEPARLGWRFDLPTEAQWEYACRAGTTTPYHFGTKLDHGQANFGRRDGRTSRVGSYAANAWGLHDMHGNVWEWCKDKSDPYPGGKQTDPVGAGDPRYRVRRGGSWYEEAPSCRSASRGRDAPLNRFINLGMRLAQVSSRNSKSVRTK